MQTISHTVDEHAYMMGYTCSASYGYTCLECTTCVFALELFCIDWELIAYPWLDVSSESDSDFCILEEIVE